MQPDMSLVEQSSNFDEELEECCICSEEFSNDTDLASHLLEHAEESPYQYDTDSSSRDSNAPPAPGTPTKMVYPEYTKTSFVGDIPPMRINFTQPSSTPEVCEINSDEEDVRGKGPVNVGNNLLHNIPSTPPPIRRPSPMQPVPVRRSPMTPNRISLVRSPNLTMAVRQHFNSVMNNNQVRPRVPPQALRFVCKLCQKPFGTMAELRNHELNHEKPYPNPCHICKKTFAYKHTLRQHLRLHIGENIHQCPVCRKRFTIKAVLQKHCKEMHNIDAQP